MKKSMNRLWWWLVASGVSIGLAVAVLFCWRARGDGQHSPDPYNLISKVENGRNNRGGGAERQKNERSKNKKKAGKRQNRSTGVPERKTEKPEIEVDDEDLSPAERTLKDAIEKALDDEDIVAARTLAAQAMIASNTEIREAMVNTLGWFGVKALPELTPFLADPDEDVRDSAMNEWSVAVSEIEDEAEKLGVVELAMHVLTNEDALEDISGEYIGTDEKLAVESLLRVIEAGGSKDGIAKAKETYEFVTGEEFVDRAAAEKWLAEEYEPPEKE